jgi:RibD C-terminal domain
MLIYGSASIVQNLTNHGLIDEYQVLVHPVILGGGKPLCEPIVGRPQGIWQSIHEAPNLKTLTRCLRQKGAHWPLMLTTTPSAPASIPLPR